MWFSSNPPVRPPRRFTHPLAVVGYVALLVVGIAVPAATAVTAAVPRNSVGTAQLRNGAVTNPKIANNAVGTAKIRNGVVTNPILADRSVGIAKMRDAAIGTAQLRDGSVTAAKLAAGAVTVPPLGPNSVGTTNIQPGAVTDAQLAENAVSTRTIQNGAVTGAKLAADAVGANNIANGAVTGAKVATGANGLTGANIQPGSLTGANIANHSLTGAQIDESTLNMTNTAQRMTGGELNLTATDWAHADPYPLTNNTYVQPAHTAEQIAGTFEAHFPANCTGNRSVQIAIDVDGERAGGGSVDDYSEGGAETVHGNLVGLHAIFPPTAQFRTVTAHAIGWCSNELDTVFPRVLSALIHVLRLRRFTKS